VTVAILPWRGESLSAANIDISQPISVRYGRSLVIANVFLILFMRPPVFVSRPVSANVNAAIIAKKYSLMASPRYPDTV